MSTTINLPGDHTAVLRDSSELSNKAFRQIRNTGLVAAGVANQLAGATSADTAPEAWANIAGIEVDELNKIDLFQQACVLARLVSWTMPEPIPTTVDEVDELERPLYEALVTAAVDIKWTEDFTVAGAADPKADTAG